MSMLRDAFARAAPRWAMPVLLATAVFLSALPLLGAGLQNGDSAVYAHQIDEGKLGIRTTHFGFFALGLLFRRLVPGSTELAMNALSAVMGALGVAAVAAAARRLCGSTLAGLAAAAAAWSMPALQHGMVLAEVDVPLAALIALAFALYVHGQAIGAGVALGWAMLVSPLAAVALPAFVLIAPAQGEAIRRDDRAWALTLTKLAVAAVLVWLPVVLWHRQDYFHGDRGVLTAYRRVFDLGLQASESLAFFGRQFAMWWPLALAGALSFATSPLWLLRMVPIALATSLAAGVLAERFAGMVPVQLPNALLISVLVGAAAQHIAAGFRLGAIALVLACLITTGPPARSGAAAAAQAKLEDRASLLALRDTCAPRRVILVARLPWADQMQLERILYGKTYTDNLLSPERFAAHVRAVALDPSACTVLLKKPGIGTTKRLEEVNLEAVPRSVRGREWYFLHASAADNAQL